MTIDSKRGKILLPTSQGRNVSVATATLLIIFYEDEDSLGRISRLFAGSSWDVVRSRPSDLPMILQSLVSHFPIRGNDGPTHRIAFVCEDDGPKMPWTALLSFSGVTVSVVRIVRRDITLSAAATFIENSSVYGGSASGEAHLDLHVGRAMIRRVTSRRLQLRSIAASRKISIPILDLADLEERPETVRSELCELTGLDPRRFAQVPQPVARVRADEETDAVNRLAGSLRDAAEVAIRQWKLSPLKRIAAKSNDATRIAAVYLVKDEEDIIFSNLIWHFSQGFRQFVVLDNDSRDGTRAEIERFRRTVTPLGGKILICDDAEIGYYQSAKTTAAANLATDYFGAEWVFPLDADEFIQAQPDGVLSSIFRIEKFMESEIGLRRNHPLFVAALEIPHFNYYCTPNDDLTQIEPTRRLRFRDKKAVGFKSAARWSKDFIFTQGNHRIRTVLGDSVPTIDGSRFGLSMRHYPQRSFDHFRRKVQNGGIAYEMAPDLSARAGSHWRLWYGIWKEGGDAALQEVFERDFVKDSSTLKSDPLPPVTITRDRVEVASPKPTSFELLLEAMPAASVAGATFVPEQIALWAPPARNAVSLRLGTSDVPTFFQVFVRKDYNIHFDEDPKYILDLGANIGLAAAYFLGRFPQSSVGCIEPNPANFAMLQRNLSGESNAQMSLAAVWPETRTLEIIATDSAGQDLGFWGTQTRAAEGPSSAEGVLAYTIPDIMAQFGFPRLDVLKIDIEGAELELFKGDVEAWIPLCSCIIVETHDRFRPGSLAAVQEAMSRYAYTVEQSGENLVYRRVPS